MSTKIVYWAPMLQPQKDDNWNLLFIEPERLLNKFINDTSNLEYDRIKKMKRCPAFTNLSRNTFYVENPIETEFNIDNRINIELGLSYLFFCEEDMELLMTSPYFSETTYTKHAMIVPGRFNISKWFRPFNLEMMLINTQDKFKIKEHEHLAYFTFLTDEKVILKRFQLNETLRKIATTLSNVSQWWQNIPLLKRYDRFLKTKTNRVVITEIKKQLVV